MSKFMNAWAAYCAQHGVPDRLELMLCDINSVLRGKWLPGEEVDKLTSGQVRLPLSTYAPSIFGWEVEDTGYGIEVGDPDGILVPVPETLRPVPWARGNVAQVLVEMTDETGEISELSTRQILSRMVDRLADQGLRPVVATELEFYVVKSRKFADAAPEPPERLPEAQNYDLEVLSRKADMLNDILSASAEQGLPTDTLIAEYGPGQFEINFHHTDDVLAAADVAQMFRRLVRSVVASHGFEATFMAKPYSDNPGSGMHAHVSMLDMDGNNVFSAKEDELASDRLKHAVGGVLSTMRELQAIFAPHMNSYRRFQVNSFAPSQTVWGYDNRAAAVRLPETHGPGARLEHRICGADVNPYLALAAILGGMDHGMRNKIDPGPPLETESMINAPRLSHDWIRSVERLERSKLAAEILGQTFRDIYITIRRNEISELVTMITPQEYSTYLSRL
jgi:glutamine synthetase